MIIYLLSWSIRSLVPTLEISCYATLQISSEYFGTLEVHNITELTI